MGRFRIAERGERLVYRIAGLPVALSGLWLLSQGTDGADLQSLDAAFASRYWRPEGVGEVLELAAAVVAWPVALVAGSLWYTARNSAAVRRRVGKGAARQIADQLRLYFSTGVLAPWYYIFSLDEDGEAERARSFLQRFQTKTCLFVLLKPEKGSPLNDKARFAQHCVDHGIRTVDVIMHLEGSIPGAALPDRDLFVKWSRGRGGRGAERWDRVAPFVYSGPGGRILSGDELLKRLVRRSRDRALVVQPRLHPHPVFAEITAGALPTARVVTCLNEAGEPEVIVSILRTSIGANRTVDNMHAGGIAAAVDIESGRLSRASDLGTNSRLGWLSAHPDTGAPIEGLVLPYWEETKRLAMNAHRVFRDRVVIGWDIAILDDGPIIIEGNGNPDMDIMQRFMRVGLRRHRLGELIAFHLKRLAERREDAFPPGETVLTCALDEADRRHPHQRQANAGRAGFGAQFPAQQPRQQRIRRSNPQRKRVS